MFLEKYFTQSNILGEMNKKITLRKKFHFAHFKVWVSDLSHDIQG